MATARLEPQKQSAKTISLQSTRNYASSSSANAGRGCVIAEGTTIEGELQSVENIRLDGLLKGSIVCERRLVIGTSGKVEGSAFAKEADISGVVEGDVQTEHLLTLRASARVTGQIRAKQISVEVGAIFSGKLEMK